jgi:hypothetical protein
MKSKYELNSNLIPLFNGTYESMWEVYGIDDDGNELEINYNNTDLMQSIIKAYKSEQPQILRDLKQATDFITNITFKDSFYSPKEYNFSTDEIDFIITVNKLKLKKTLKELQNDQEFKKFLYDNYTSYDGFISFTPDNPKDLIESIIMDNQESDQAIGALITYLTKANDALNEIEMLVYDYWGGNGYAGLNYSIVTEKKKKKTLKIKG